LGGYNGEIGKHRPTGSYRRIDIGGYPPPPQLADPQSIIVNSVPAIGDRSTSAAVDTLRRVA
jgi:hypothetical protein